MRKTEECDSNYQKRLLAVHVEEVFGEALERTDMLCNQVEIMIEFT